MALGMRTLGKGVRFEYHDEDASTVVGVSADDDQDTIVRKLRRVIALVEGEQPIQMPLMGQIGNYGGPLVPMAAEPPQLGPEQAANGWEMLSPDDLDDAPGESG